MGRPADYGRGPTPLGSRRISTYTDVVSGDTEVLAEAVATDPTAAVACYDGWDLADLARHVGTIQRWVTGIVGMRATERPPWPDIDEVADGDLPQWLVRGAAGLVEALDTADPDDEVWTFSPTGSPLTFWQRRMALESAIHRWDAEDALGRDASVAPWLALEGVEEALYVYLEPRLDGRDVGGDGQRVAFVPERSTGWTMTLRPAGIEVTPGHADVDATVRGTALDLWLLLMCRSSLDEVEVAGDTEAAAHAVEVTTWVPGPAG